ncbi:MAG: hypothetical protein AUK44_09940 [Porphyromonadaceae bacterium CG2_30_38_12]|nr:MAG: hypothetical protein AUK44_09940 [Porphyromonadaceae bacterium CG2_30_38_12]
MLIVLSPTKIQNFEVQHCTSTYSLPLFMNEAEQLVSLLRALNPTEISKLLAINTKLTSLNYDRFFNFQVPFTPQNAKQAILAFDGEVFRGLEASNFTPTDFEFAQKHLLIYSGLYGALRPLDLIQPYRLEISTALQNQYGKDMYAFWQDKITRFTLSQLEATAPQILINLASSEYFKAFKIKDKNIKILEIEFYEYKNDSLKQIVIYTKKARGMMARYLIKNKISYIEDIKGFADAGYWFDPALSTQNKYIFVR